MDLHSRLDSDLRLSRRSKRTRSHYLQHARRFLAHFPDRKPEDLGEEDVRAYLHHLIEVRGVGQYTHKMAVAAIKFLFDRTLARPEAVARIPWPRVTSPLPTILPAPELVALVRAAVKPMVRPMLLTGYSAGLRVSEVCRLQVPDLDTTRGVIVVRGGKGGKDRLTLLPARLLRALRAHWKETRPPGPWIFPGQTEAGHVSQRYLHEGFRQALRTAGIRRPGVRFHSLRHSFATHMLEAGVDIRVLQSLLGHRRMETTSRYAQVRTDLIAQLPDPLDLLASAVKRG